MPVGQNQTGPEIKTMTTARFQKPQHDFEKKY